jgi:hypothetical protein
MSPSPGCAEGNPAYAETVGKTAGMQRNYDGKQPGALLAKQRNRRLGHDDP